MFKNFLFALAERNNYYIIIYIFLCMTIKKKKKKKKKKKILLIFKNILFAKARIISTLLIIQFYIG